MGMYDTIVIDCPKCKEPYHAQSKGGSCLLENYYFPNVPRDVLSDINRHAPFVCDKCKTQFFVDFKKNPIQKIVLDWSKPFIRIIKE